MNELVSPIDIQNYAIRNTAERMPIERKYLNAFVSSLFNSTAMKSAYEVLRNSMWNEELPMMFLSYWDTTGSLNKEPYRSIIAYAMIKKDANLLTLISNALFTGTTEIVYDENFAEDFVEYTDQGEEGSLQEAYFHTEPVEEPYPAFDPDETYKPTDLVTYADVGYICKTEHTGPWNANDFEVMTPGHYIDWQIQTQMHYSDAEIYTDMVGGIPYLVFKNLYCDDAITDPIFNSRYQTREELEANLPDFINLISICKPARAEVLIVYQPFCYMTGNATELVTAGIAANSVETPLQSPFADNTYYNTILGLTDEQLLTYYNSVSALDINTGLGKTQDELTVTRTVERGTGYMLMTFQLHTRFINFIWGNIIVKGWPEETHPEYPFLPDIRFSPKDVMEQGTTKHYFMTFSVKFPRND